MDPTLAVILTILSSLLSFLLASIFQIIRDQNNRKEQKEDFLLQRRIEVVKKRVNNSEMGKRLDELSGLRLCPKIT